MAQTCLFSRHARRKRASWSPSFRADYFRGRDLRATIGDVGFKFLLRLEDGEPSDPAVLVTAVPNCTVGETFSTGRGHE